MSNNLNFYEIVAGADNSRAMEARDHSKKRGESEKPMSRGNFLKPKKLLTLVFAMLLGMASAFAQGGTTGPLTWSLDPTTGILTISGEGDMPDYTYDPYSAAPWRTYQNVITTVVIKNEVTSIGKYAFGNCAYATSYEHLTSITIPNNVTSIGNNAFSACVSLKSINIPNGIQTIGNSAFQNCKNLTSIILPGSLKTIETNTFNNCTALVSVIILNGVTTIEEYAFLKCSALPSITIPNSVTTIEFRAFQDCSGLTSLTLPFTGDGSRHNLGRLFGVAKNDEMQEVIQGTGMVGGGIPYYLPKNLSQLTITNEEKIRVYALENCSMLQKVTILSNVTVIEHTAFSGCSGLPSITLPNSLKTIEANAFSGCSALTSVTIPSNVTQIKIEAFSDCTSLQTVNYNAINCTSMGGSDFSVFEGCTALTTLNIGNMVESIPDDAFGACSNLLSVHIYSNNITSIGTNAFPKNIIIEELTIPNVSNFYTPFITSHLKKLIIGMECTTIPSGTLNQCKNLTDLTLPYIGTSLSATTSLSTLFGSTGVPGSLEKLIITRPAEQIAAHALSGCNKLKEVTIPSTIRGLGEGAMYGCNGLDHIYSHWAYPPSAYNNSTFEGVNKYACILHVPIGSKEKYASADGWKEFYNIQEEAAVTITARPIPLYGGIIEGVLQYNYDETATLTASGNMGYDFQAWMENETIVSTNKEYSFLVEGPRTLYAIFTPRENENGVEVITHPTEAVIIWDGEPGASGYTLIIYLDAERTIEYVRFEFDEFGNPRGTISCIVTDLTEGDRYYYTLTAYDEEHYALTIAIGNFVTGEADIETIETSTVKIYPNPVKDVLTITNYESGITSVKIYDLLGKEVMESNLSDGKVDVSPLSPRGYILRIGGYAVRFVKE